ncbi:hypothetical protein GCM10011380_08930 [Sphingomonas metalli]|uniref:Uncharacterized protein n=1 Tax=Sphingomonas metalli TaxID=1779358 RepID=A0A916SY30_9SPHN|nr:hypothetical protein [Sphingomonas metalli]GGB21561.1 hypothetical protein GCM10011380_08930 [Sphingomonas metalli]
MSERTDPPRLPALVPMLCALVGALATLGGLLVTIGGWRGAVDTHLETIDRRLDQAESNQRTYIPVLLGLNKDVSYLADRARREDARADREQAK